jgi:hypothetical protein
MNNTRPIALLAALTLPLISTGAGDPRNDPQWVRIEGELQFEDRFEREETDPQREDLGPGWTTSSAERAKGNKQVTLSGGFLQITRHPVADHAVSVRHPLEFANGAIEARIRLGAGDDFTLNFADMELPTVHAGHLSLTRWTLKDVTMTDAKTGIFDLALRERRLKGEKSPELEALLAAKTRTFPCALTPGQWHTVLVVFEGDEMRVSLDGKALGAHRSIGFAHPTKRLIRFLVSKSAELDDVRIWKLPAR